MILNIIIICFLLLMVYMWSMHGIFSAFLHLIISITAGALAFAVWEPLTTGFLLDRMPEYAWGVGLLAPFVLFLLLLRGLFDRLIKGNMDFSQITNMIGGGGLGLCSGILTSGIVVIGMLFIGPCEVNYLPYTQNKIGEIEQTQSLWVPVDHIAASVFGTLSNGSFYPWGGEVLTDYKGDIAEQAGLFRLTPDAGKPGRRHAIQSKDVKMLSYYFAKVDDFVKAEAIAKAEADDPDKIDLLKLSEPLQPKAGKSLFMITTEFSGNSFDPDSHFTATKAQIQLGFKGTTENTISLIHPRWYIQREAAGFLSKEADYIRSKASVSNETITWVFVIPSTVKKDALAFLSIKQLRLPLPTEKPSDAATFIASIKDWSGEVAEAIDQSDPRIQGAKNEITIDDKTLSTSIMLPMPVSINKLELRSGKTDPNKSNNDKSHDLVEILGGTLPKATGDVPYNLRVTKFRVSDATKIVRLTMPIKQYQSTLGRAYGFAEGVVNQANARNNPDAKPPILITLDGDSIFPIGYALVQRDQMYIQYTPGKPIKLLSEIEPDKMDTAKEMIILYTIGRNNYIKQLKMGTETLELSPVLIVE